MNQIKKRAFTLVELIVVITILAILGTIAFISLQGYSRDARDSVRQADLANISKSLKLYEVQRGTYPEPSAGVDITYSGAAIWNQGTIGDSVINNLSQLSKKPIDPLTSSEYTYSRLNTKKEFELGAALEGGVAQTTNLISQAEAAGTLLGTAYIKGDYNGLVAKVNTGSTQYILAVPTIISGNIDLTHIINIMQSGSLVYNGTNNLPSNYRGTNFNVDGGGFTFNPNNIVVYTGEDSGLVYEPNQAILLNNLQTIYTGTDVIKNKEVENIINNTINITWPSDETKLLSSLIINQNINSNINVYDPNLQKKGSDIILNKINNLGGLGSEIFNSVIYDGINYIAVGYSSSDLTSIGGGINITGSNDFVIAKFDVNLNLLNINNLGGIDGEIFTSVIYDGINYIAVGKSDSDLTGLGGTNTVGSYDFVIAKFDTNLNLLNLNNLGGIEQEIFNSVTYDGTNYIAVGYSFSDLTGLGSGTNIVGSYDFVIAKFDTNLNLIDLQNLGGTISDVFSTIIYDGKDYIVVGFSGSDLTGLGGGTNVVGSNDFVIAKFDTNLNLIDLQNLGGGLNDVFNSVTYDGANYVAAGYSTSDLSPLGGNNNLGFNDFVMVKFDTNLNLLDLQNLGGTNSEQFDSVIYDGTNYVAVGYSASDLTGLGGGTNTVGSYDFVIAKFDINLNLLYLQNLGGVDLDILTSVIYDGTNYVAVGNSISDLTGLGGGTNTVGSYDFVITKF